MIECTQGKRIRLEQDDMTDGCPASRKEFALKSIVWLVFALICAMAAQQTGARADASPAQLIVVTTVPAQADARSARNEMLDLLGQARIAMERGNLTAAEKAIDQADAMDVSLGVFHLGDTPKKARRDLDRLRARMPKKPAPRETNTSAAPPSTRATNAAPQNSTTRTAAPAIPQQVITAPPTRDTLTAPGGTPAASQVTRNPAGNSSHPLLDARRALANGDVRSAAELVEQSKRISAQPNSAGDAPAKMELLIRKQQAINEALAAKVDAHVVRSDMLDLALDQAEGLLRWNDLLLAERVATHAAQLATEPGPLQARSQALLDQITEARQRQEVPQPGEPRPLPVNPDAIAADGALPPLASPEGVMQADFREAPGRLAGVPNQVEQTNFEFPADDQADSPFMDSPPSAAPTDPARRPPRVVNAPPRQAEPGVLPNDTAPQAESSHARFYLEQGEAALQQGDTTLAFAYFQRAQREEVQLSGQERARLVQHLSLAQKQRSEAPPQAEPIAPANPTDVQPVPNPLAAAPETVNESRPAQPNIPPRPVSLGGTAPQPLPTGEDPGKLLHEYTAGQRILQRKLSGEVANQQSRAQQLKESDPRGALEMIKQTRQMVEAAQVEPEFRAGLVRRLDKTQEDVQAYFDAHRADIDLEEKNNAVVAEVDRERMVKVEIDEKLALLVDEYNKLVDEERWPEAELTAKKAIELAPKNRLAEQLRWNANFVRRFNQQRQIELDKENGFVEALASVDASAIPMDDRNPVVFPDKLKWQDLSDRRKRLANGDGPRRSPRELQIEQKLKTPVSLQFTDAALSQVLDHLADLSDINIHVDSQGLAAEGVSTDTPVTVNLKQDISLKSALNLILEPLHLGYVIKDEVLKITSEQYRNGELTIHMYPVADLVVPIPNFVPGARMGLAGSLHDAYTSLGYGGVNGFTSQSPLAVVASRDGAPNSAMMSSSLLANVGSSPNTMAGSMLGSHAPVGSGPGGAGGGAAADFDSLIQLITSTIEPTSWDEVGGSGAIEEFRTNLSLVISQTEDVHDQIRDLLQQLRRLQDLQVTIEVRFITLNDNFFERIGVDFDFNINDKTDRPFQVFGRPAPQTPTTYTSPPPAGFFNNVPRDFQERDFNKQNTTVVGLQAPDVFSADLDVPFRQNSFGLAVPQFGGFDPAAGASLGFAILSDIEAFFFINAATGDRRTNVLQAPKVTLFNGQQATVSDTSQSPFVISVIPVVGDFAAAQQPVIVVLNEGTFMTVQATVSSDRRFVRLTIVPFFSNIGEVSTFTFEGSATTRESSSSDGPADDTTDRSNQRETVTSGTTVQLPTFSFVTVTTTVSVPDGGTILLGGIKRLSEGRSEFGVPILSKLPYINRLFRNVGIGRETQSLMMMVTPRIIIQEEEEALLGITPTP